MMWSCVVIQRVRQVRDVDWAKRLRWAESAVGQRTAEVVGGVEGGRRRRGRRRKMTCTAVENAVFLPGMMGIRVTGETEEAVVDRAPSAERLAVRTLWEEEGWVRLRGVTDREGASTETDAVGVEGVWVAGTDDEDGVVSGGGVLPRGRTRVWSSGGVTQCTDDQRGRVGGDGTGLGGGVARGGSVGVAAVGRQRINGRLGDEIQDGRGARGTVGVMVIGFWIRCNSGAGQLRGRLGPAGSEGFGDDSLFFCTSKRGGEGISERIERRWGRDKERTCSETRPEGNRRRVSRDAKRGWKSGWGPT